MQTMNGKKQTSGNEETDAFFWSFLRSKKNGA